MSFASATKVRVLCYLLVEYVTMKSSQCVLYLVYIYFSGVGNHCRDFCDFHKSVPSFFNHFFCCDFILSLDMNY